MNIKLRAGNIGATSAFLVLTLVSACGGGNAGSESATNGGADGSPELPLADAGPQQQSSQLDVLFVIDNSASMDDKTAVLVQSVPGFIARLVNPPCVDDSGIPTAMQPASGTEPCKTGRRERSPVRDMHVGVITSSIGNHGGSFCTTPATDVVDPHLDDQAELIPSKRTGVPSYLDSGFASWDASGLAGDSETVVTEQVQAMIAAVGHSGCALEAPLEAMYRFLVDPEPPISIERDVYRLSVSTGVNEELLAQRAAFLRPSSALAIVLMSDENDCSIRDDGVGWFVGSTSAMPKASVECASDPNDPCCRSCATVGGFEDCPALENDANCAGVMGNTYNTWDDLNDSWNLRCFAQKRRFGFDLLNPLWRYSVGLTNPMIYDRAGKLVQNPLLAQRSASLVSVSVLVGAPWQDLATAESSSADTLTFLSASELEDEQRWPLLVGDPKSNVEPSDPLMVESIDPRTGTSPVTGATLVPADSTDPLANPSNGHEQNLPNRNDLQFACIFALPTERDCTKEDSSCQCTPDRNGSAAGIVANNSPLCQPPSGGPASTTQFFGQANPGTRELLFARTLGARAAPASICPKQSSGDGPSFGYLPALDALVNRIAITLE
ncbi:MAG TPA: hypothetical protein VER96_29175 [Polyangiaceae bacterium]|nr:hypothetical protein [Polyangiaceae bacterium]